jgi:hypothetical protein
MGTRGRDYETASLRVMNCLRNLVKFSTWVVLRGVAQDSREGNLLGHLVGGSQPGALPFQACGDISAPSSSLPPIVRSWGQLNVFMAP